MDYFDTVPRIFIPFTMPVLHSSLSVSHWCWRRSPIISLRGRCCDLATDSNICLGIREILHGRRYRTGPTKRYGQPLAVLTCSFPMTSTLSVQFKLALVSGG